MIRFRSLLPRHENGRDKRPFFVVEINIESKNTRIFRQSVVFLPRAVLNVVVFYKCNPKFTFRTAKLIAL